MTKLANKAILIRDVVNQNIDTVRHINNAWSEIWTDLLQMTTTRSISAIKDI